jgi:hypothetical protein
MDAIDFAYATEVVRRNKRKRRGVRADSQGNPIRRKSSVRRKVSKLAAVAFFFGLGA